MNNSYHNTTAEDMQLTIYYESKARQQEHAVMSLMQIMIWASPSKIHELLIARGTLKPNTPLTSTRRAITNLTARGYLKKTDEKVIGSYGRRECIWEKL